MSSKTQVFLPAVLLKVFAISGFLAATILVVNAAKRAGIIPTSPLTQLAAPVAQLAAIGLVIGLYIVISRKAGTLGAWGIVLSVAALGGLVGVEFVLNLIFPYVDPSVITAVRAGPLGIALIVVSMLFLIGTIVFMVAMWRNSNAPKVAVVLYALSVVPISFRTAFPETVLQLGLVGLAVAAVWLSVWLLRTACATNDDAAVSESSRSLLAR